MKILSTLLFSMACFICIAANPGTEIANEEHAKCYVKLSDNKANFVIHVNNAQQPGIYTVVKTFANGIVEQIDIHKTKPHPEGKATWHSFIDETPGCNPVNGVPYGYSLMRMDETGKAMIVTSWKYHPEQGEVSAL